ncbi:MAG: DUF1653 domain-containing protein [Lachnospiraceae bacterium]|nr:DUF1653 domain-containing protein [Lachnospiraceae bacterium]MBQ9119876.1 DUF1653 domain-containing protein [Lachnospiraceae bacterium]
MALIPKPQEIYRHFKGNLYQIVTIAEHSETGEPLVIYQALYGDYRIYARPLAMFLSKVDRTKYPDSNQEYRFERQDTDQLTRSANHSVREYTPIQERTPLRQGTAEQKHIVPQQSICGQQSTIDTQVLTMPVQPTTSEIEASEELTLDPMVLEFLDADSYEQRLNILAGLHHRITNEMITTMAIACDIEVEDGDVEQRYDALRTCLLTLEKYECNRLR